MTNSVWLCFCLLSCFVAGYLLGRVNSIADMLRQKDEQPSSFLRAAKMQTPPKTTVSIDDTKYVAPISTDGLSRPDTTIAIGKTMQTQDDIQSSVSKLAQLKGK